MLGLPTERVARAPVDHRRLGRAGQDRVLPHGDHVVEPFVLEIREALRTRKAAMTPHADPRVRKRRAQQRHESAQHSERALAKR